MANVFVQDHEMTAIANTLREVNNTDEKYLLSEIPDAIEEGVIKYANKKTVVGSSVAITDAADMRLIGLKVYGYMGMPNLVKPYMYEGDYIETNGVSVAFHEDGSFTLNGTATTDITFGGLLPPLQFDAVGLSDGETYIFDFGLSEEDESKFKFEFWTHVQKLREPFVVRYPQDPFIIDVTINSGSTFNNVTVYPNLNKGDKLLPWTPSWKTVVVEEQIKVYMSNDIESKEVIIPIDGGLYGFEELNKHAEVIRDYIDFDKKKLVRYYTHEYIVSSIAGPVEYTIWEAPFNDMELEAMGVDTSFCILKDYTRYSRVDSIDNMFERPDSNQYLCDGSRLWIQDSRFPGMTKEQIDAELAANPLVFVFPTREPIEIDLTYEQIKAFEQMRMFMGETTIVNDSFAEMEITYIVNPESGVV